MEKDSPLKPFWFDSSRQNDKLPLRNPIDELDSPLASTVPDSGQRDPHAVANAECIVRKRLHEADQGPHKRRTLESSSVVNSDALNSDDLEKMTTCVYRSSSRPSVGSSESLYFFNRVPSSPPASLLRDTYDDGGMLLSSPSKVQTYQSDDIQTSQMTIVPDRGSDSDDSESTVDFNINNLNKVNGYLSSDNLMSDPTQPNDTDATIVTRGRIARCIEEGNPKLHIENLGLTVLPDDVEDMKNMVCWNKGRLSAAQIEIYAAQNKLKILPPCLFNVEQICVLSLRGNKLKKIPGIIWKMKNLTELSIMNNDIKVLPYQILKLPKLTNLLVRPNASLIELRDQDPHSYYCIANAIPNQDGDIRRYVSRVKWSHRTTSGERTSPERTDREIAHSLEVSPVPKLSELALRRFCHYDVTLSETKLWKRTIPIYTQRMVTKALQKGIYDECCSVCDKVTVNPIAKALEWWDFKDQTLVPVRRNFCCGNCVNVWLDDVEDTLERMSPC